MSIAPRDPDDRQPSPDDDVVNEDLVNEDLAAHRHGSFFGRRKGHKLRSHQADLIAQLLPRLALDIAAPGPPGLAELFEPPVDHVRL
jgi:tRNA (guanine-N7-)-methyltransferase